MVIVRQRDGELSIGPVGGARLIDERSPQTIDVLPANVGVPPASACLVEAELIHKAPARQGQSSY